ncbi:MAG: transketolase [Candidatus Woesearchaeota archaeon]
MSDSEAKRLEGIAKKSRRLVIEMCSKAQSGHTGGSLGAADIFTALYFYHLHHNPKKPQDPLRDRFVLSCGHISPILYATLAQRGYFKKSWLKTFRKINSKLQGHPNHLDTQGVETSSGSLGQGLSIALGMALGLRLQNNPARVYAYLSDGEQEEGSTWEAVMAAAHFKVDNLTAILDYNNIQISGYNKDVMNVMPLREKYESFGWHVLEADGHNMKAILEALEDAKTIKEKPTVIIAYTTMGKGVPFMENKYEWHGKAPSKEEAKQALKVLK